MAELTPMIILVDESGFEASERDPGISEHRRTEGSPANESGRRQSWLGSALGHAVEQMCKPPAEW
jgi:hypothetical protein